MKLNYITLSLLIILVSGCLGSGSEPASPDANISAGASPVLIEEASYDILLTIEFPEKALLSQEFFLNEGETLNAAEALDSIASVEYQEFAFGKMITGVNDVVPAENEYWAIYLNGGYAQTGISQIELAKGDELKLMIEQMSDYTG